jgi:antitoxin FitA
MPNVQIRDVPPEVHRQLKAQAALAGQSLNEYLLARFRELAGTPTVPELIEQIRQRGPYGGPASAAIIREARDHR